jgi:hypothetical protein
MGKMETAYDLAAVAVRQRLAEQQPERLEKLDQIRKREIAVYSGSYDSVEKVLSRLGVPFDLNPSPKRLRARLVFANCSYKRPRGLLGAVEPFVREGGWFVSSDWSLDNYIQRKFPDTVAWKDERKTGHEVVAVEPACDSLWEDAAVPGADPQWWLWGSYPIEILNFERVRVEAASHELLRRFDAPAVSVRFDWHAGHVYHIISHFWVKYTRTPKARYRGPCSDYMKVGLRLSDDSVVKVLDKANLKADDLNFAELQSAATATELTAQLCIEAMKVAKAPSRKVGWLGMLGLR